MSNKADFTGEELLCPIRYFLDVAGGKWKTSILCILATGKPQRYSLIRRKLGNITNTMLAQSLQQLEDEGMVDRMQYNEIPPRVEYRLTEKGMSMVPVLIKMAKWGNDNMPSENQSYCLSCQNTN